MLTWFDSHPQHYWWLVLLFFAVVFYFLVRPLLTRDWKDTKGSDWRWSWVILAMLVAGRWPTWFITREYNEDESRLIAGALTLRHDGMFWRSVDGGTAGPLDFFALLPFGWIFGGDGYMSARLTALVLLAGTLLFVHQALAITVGRQAARIATFGAATMEALTIDKNLLHYSSELVSCLLLGCVVWLNCRRFFAGGGRRENLFGGLLLGAIPFAKLQGAPLALALGVIWFVAEILVQRNEASAPNYSARVLLVVGGIIPVIGFVALAFHAGIWRDFFIPYVLNNLNYVERARDSLLDTVVSLGKASLGGALIGWWLLGGVAWVAAAFALTRPLKQTSWKAIAGTTAFTIFSTVVVITPHRAFLHYTQYLIVPAVVLFGTEVSLLATTNCTISGNQRRALVLSAIAFMVLPVIFARSGRSHPHIGMMAPLQSSREGPLSSAILRYARRGESLGVWGWKNSCYAEAGFRQATRSADSESEILVGPYQNYFRQRYLADLRTSMPPVIVDVAKPSTLLPLNRSIHAQAIFPELAAFLEQNYRLVEMIDGDFLFVRNDRQLLAAASPSTSIPAK